jgi:hypothetical protein
MCSFLVHLPYFIYKQEVLRRTNRLLPLIRHRPQWKRRVQQLLYCYVCIRYRGNVSTEPLPSSDKGTFTEPLPSNDRRDTHTQTATWSHKPTLFLARFPYFEKIKWAYGITLLSARVCLVGNDLVKIPLSLIGNGSVKITLSLLGNGSVGTLPR